MLRDEIPRYHSFLPAVTGAASVGTNIPCCCIGQTRLRLTIRRGDSESIFRSLSCAAFHPMAALFATLWNVLFSSLPICN